MFLSLLGTAWAFPADLVDRGYVLQAPDTGEFAGGVGAPTSATKIHAPPSVAAIA